MGYGVKFRVWGDYACFTRPEFKVERVSYDVITPSAARAIIECIYWKPSIKWVIDKITVMNPIKFGNIMLNEIKDKVKQPKGNFDKDLTMYATINDNRVQRGMMYLKDPDYIIEAHFEPTGVDEDANDFKKHYNVVLRRLKNGQVFKQPYFGIRNFSANIKYIADDEIYDSKVPPGEVDLGFMLYDLKFKSKQAEETGKKANSTDEVMRSSFTHEFLNNADPIFFRPIMKNGIIDVAECYKNSARGVEL